MNGFGFGNGNRKAVLDSVTGGECDPEYGSYLEGEVAYVDGRAIETCPYPPGRYRAEWERGYKVAQQKAKMGGLQ